MEISGYLGGMSSLLRFFDTGSAGRYQLVDRAWAPEVKKLQRVNGPSDICL